MTVLYLIPGTGTDYRMFAPQLEVFPQAVVPQWLPPASKKESVTSYARRLAGLIDTSKPFIIGGVSLGGMIAQEMALVLKPEAVLMISTCSTSKALPLIWRLQGRLTRATPNALVKLQLKLGSWFAKRLDEKKFPHKAQYAAMLAEISPELVRWQSGAATEWVLSAPLTMPVVHIHGGKDKIVPVKNVKPDHMIADGGHLINITHAGEVNVTISELLLQFAGEKAA